jgi:membrane protease YdiL (CAAX protease family)
VSGNLLAHLFFVAILILPLQAVRGIHALDRQVLIDRSARLEFYRVAMISQWLLMPFVVAASWNPAPLRQTLGLVLPTMSTEDLAIAIVLAILLLSQSPIVPAVRRRLAGSQSLRHALHPLRNLLPRSEAEKRRWVAVSATAGICEEIVFRGFLFYYLQQVIGLSLYGAIVSSSFIFAISHYYQGLNNVVRIGLVGLLLAILYAVTDSLVLPIALHILLDLGALNMAEFVPSDDAPPGAESPNFDDEP